MEEKHYRQLIDRYIRRQATDEELEVFFTLLEAGKLDALLTEIMDAQAGISQEDEDSRYQLQVQKRKEWPWLGVAASLFIVFVAGLLFYQHSIRQKDSAAKLVTKIQPGKDAAVLQLADGRRIDLTSVANGTIASEGGVTIVKLANGELSYRFNSTTVSNGEPQHHIISTPRGGQYRMNLPDGTKVWLNSASSLRFPAVFAAGERKVGLVGEGYFEVAKDPDRPFRVRSIGQEVQVLGTHFNINSYPDEHTVQTTLLEGSVAVRSLTGNLSKILRPGQKSDVTDDLILISEANIANALAWKDGNFNFNREGIRPIMRKLARWYNIEVVYEGDIAEDQFVGIIPRKEDITDVLEMLEQTGQVHFRVEERRITVMP